jgi:sensor c-di-GMP phosphodiesterase-like protein
LGLDATRAINEGNTYARDVHSALDTMNASKYPYCSEEDLGLLRKLLYASHFLKEIGRIRDNKIVCSTKLGREDPSGAELPQPDAIGTDGVKAYRNIPVFRLPDVRVVALRDADSYVVLFPYFDNLRGISAIHKKVTTVSDSEQNRSLLLAGAPSPPSWNQLTTSGDFRIGEIMFSTRCSSLKINHICTTAYLSFSEALELDHRDQYTFTFLGGLIGIFIGAFCSILYGRKPSMEKQLRRAIKKDQLRVAYQPIVDLANRSIVGAEALARWSDEDGNAVGPDVFVKIAEQHGFVGEITRLVVQRAVRDFADVLRANPDFRLSINVAAADLSDARFLPMLVQSLDKEGVSAESIAIEITESSTARHEVAMETIRHLHRLGHCVHIDDFGTGYSSLSYLQDLSVDAIKIDRSFTRSIGMEAVTSAILPQILALAEALHLRVIVEGIETSSQASYFKSGAQPILGQGWLFGRPVPTAEFHRLLAEEVKALPIASEDVYAPTVLTL